MVSNQGGLVWSNDSLISGINMTPSLQNVRHVAASLDQSFRQLHTETWLRTLRVCWELTGGEVHVLDNDCQLLYKYFHIFSAVKQNNEQMRKSQSLTSWDEFPLCTVLEISHHASLQAAQTWKYFISRKYFYKNDLTIMCDWLLSVWKVLQMFWQQVTSSSTEQYRNIVKW